LEGYVAEFRYYFQVLDQDELTAIQDELLDKYVGRLKVSERAKLTATTALRMTTSATACRSMATRW